MDDFFEEDVTGTDSDELGALIKLRIQRYERIEVFRDAGRVVLRTWTDAEQAEPEDEL